MTILSHRGYWRTKAEKNTVAAFERSFALGFGTETDVRDFHRELLIAHDPPAEAALTFEAMLQILVRHDRRLPLAINIKADGLQPWLLRLLSAHGIENYFLFDMSVPDAVFSHRQGLRIFTRHSDVEPVPALYAEAAGVWLDGFHSTWFGPREIAAHRAAGKQVCLVSPELHGRPHGEFWTALHGSAIVRDPGVMLCTDLPEEARAFFQEVSGGL